MSWSFRPFLLAALLGIGDVVFAQDLRVRPVVGGLPADSGFALGLELQRTGLLGPADVRTKLIGSVRKYWLLESALEIDQLSTPWLSLTVAGRYRNYPQEDFWGLGPDTQPEQRSNFLQEDLDAMVAVAVSFQRMRAGSAAGFLKINTGPGRDDRFPSVPESLQSSPRYTHAGLFLQYDGLDDASDPRVGEKYEIRWTTFGTLFQRYEIDLRRFVPIAAKDRLGFRLQAVFTDSTPGAVVPFFMLPTAGGVDTVRGFKQYRFRDNHSLVLNTEYRRSVLTSLDAVGFIDAGRVFSRARQLGLGDLRPSAGIGARLRFDELLFFGVDFAFSGEGRQLWFRGGHTF